MPWEAAGSFGQTFTITNASSQPCGLPRWVTNVHGTIGGKRQALSKLARTGRDEASYPLSATTLAPGEQAAFEFGEGDPAMCGTPQPEVKLVTSVTFSIGPKATFTKRLTLKPKGSEAIVLDCDGPWITEIGAARANAPSWPENNIETSGEVPTRVAAGQPMDYTVTVTNDNSNVALSLSPCPRYSAWFGMNQDVVNGRLDCGGQRSLPPDGSISFHLSIRAPSRPGKVRFGWTVPGGRSAISPAGTGATILITK